MRVTATFFALAPLLALAQPAKLVARQDAPVEVPEGPLPVCTNYCFGMWGWPIVSPLRDDRRSAIDERKVLIE